uniref:Uncharacterized protein n=1 Tax=Meloidogyne enterolobii TaxID=390850 RepID=A0A6V7WJ23_MELEN|nr:unnamed protein product [Meloidogyne enterolobii]
MHQSIPLIFILFIFLLRFSNFIANEDKKLEKSLTLSDWMKNYPEEQETGNTGVSNINVPMNDDDDKVDFTFAQPKTVASNEAYDDKYIEIAPFSSKKIDVVSQMKGSNQQTNDEDVEDEISEDEDFSFNNRSNIQGPVVKETKEKIGNKKYNEKGQDLLKDRSNRNTQQSIQSSLHPRANTKIVDKVDNKGCFVWSFNLQKNKEKMREGKEDKQKRDQTKVGRLGSLECATRVLPLESGH